MNPSDRPVKFTKGTRVKVTQGNNFGMIGVIDEERHGSYSNKIKFDTGGYLWLSDHELEALPVPEIGDLVRVTHAGRWQAHEGHVTSIDAKTGMIFVDLDNDWWERPGFTPEYLEIIEKVKPKPVRIEGKVIKPEDVRRGDKISVVSIEENEIKRTTILEATVDKIVPKGFYGKSVEFQTRTGAKIYTNETPNKAVISLVSSIDNDLDYQTLSQAKFGDIIGFADEDGGVETNIAVKQTQDFWSVMLGAKKSKSMETVGLVNVLKKKNVAFSVIRTATATTGPEFPVGTNVKVLSGYSASLSDGDYRVVIAGDTNSTIKSRGISAATHSVPNRWLVKG